MPTADEPKVSVRLDFRTHGALLGEAKRQQRKPATLVRMFVQECLGTVEQASGESRRGSGGQSPKSPRVGPDAPPAPAEASEDMPEWKRRTMYRRPHGPIPKKEK